jgi:hypothetical protein
MAPVRPVICAKPDPDLSSTSNRLHLTTLKTDVYLYFVFFLSCSPRIRNQRYGSADTYKNNLTDPEHRSTEILLRNEYKPALDWELCVEELSPPFNPLLFAPSPLPLSKAGLFPGPLFPGTLFPGTLFPGPLFPGALFPGPLFPGLLFLDLLFPDPLFPLPCCLLRLTCGLALTSPSCPPAFIEVPNPPVCMP